MNFRYTEDEEQFRRQVVDFIQENWKPDPNREVSEGGPSPAARAFLKQFFEAGYLTMAWPKEYGGSGEAPMKKIILNEEMMRYGAPGAGFGPSIVAPTLLRRGTDAQKAFFLPKILNAEITFCLGYSEPEAGSDLASLQLRAERDGDEYVLNGQKRWTSLANVADYVWLAVRTDPNAPKHRGISVLIVDMKTPGITVRPIRTLEYPTNEVYFDNVRVPRDALVGEENKGWYYIAEALDFERFGIFSYAQIENQWRPVLEWVKTAERNGRPLRDDPEVRHKIARLAIDLEICRMHLLRVAAVAARGDVPNLEPTMNKLWGTNYMQRLMNAAVDIAGLYGQLLRGSKHAPAGGQFPRLMLANIVMTIAGGSTEVMKNIIAKRGLDLPGW